MAEMLKEVARRALPPVEGDLAVDGLEGPVEVVRDRWGVPHIYASSLHDVWFAQGFVMASERLFQIEFFSRAGTGRLSELFSELALPIDRYVRTIGWNRIGRRLGAEYDDLSLEMGAAFVAGSRAWVERMPEKPVEYHVLDADPWMLPDDDWPTIGAAAAAVVAWGLSRNWDHELLRAEIAERLGPEAMRELFPDLDTEAPIIEAGKDGAPSRLALLRDAILPPPGQGSNNWVVSGSRTATGKPLLANDPHLAVSWPSIWFECHLVAPGLDVAGVALPFSPGIVIGRNERIAWGFTNTEGDVQDLYLERLSDDGKSAEYNGGWEPLTVHREEIAVRGRDAPEVLEVRESRHGPLITAYTVGIGDPTIVEGGIRRSYALRWVGAAASAQPSTLHGMNTASNWEEFRAAFRGWECPGQNAVYADIDGNIGYQMSGLYPVRRRGDGTVPVPGWTDEYEWDGWVPYDELPRAFNPEEGFLLTANNKVHGDDFPHLITHDFLPPFRARRVAELITREKRHTPETFARMQVDTVSLPAAEIVPILTALEPADDRQKQALALLADWDYDVATDSAPAAIYELWCEHIARKVLLPLLDEELFTHFHGRREWTNAFQYQFLPTLLRYPTSRWFGGEGIEARDAVLREALDGALEDLTGRLGEDMTAWRWGALHRIRFAGRLAIIPDLAELFTAGELELGGDEQTVLQGMYEPGLGFDIVVAPSWRQVIVLSDPDGSLGTNTTGQSGNPVSPHFNDHVELWGSGRLHPLPFSRRAVDDAAEATLVLRPGE